MLKMYKSETQEFRYDNIRVHPSSWFLSGVTREIFGLMFTIPGFVIGTGVMIGIGSPVTLGIAAFLLFVMFFIGSRYFRSYKMEGHTYNNVLLPLEKRYHRMSKEDRKAYRHYLESAYAMCGHRGEMDRPRLTKIEKLFKLKEIQANVLYDALDEELQLAEEIAKISRQAQKEIEQIQNKVKR